MPDHSGGGGGGEAGSSFYLTLKTKARRFRVIHFQRYNLPQTFSAIPHSADIECSSLFRLGIYLISSGGALFITIKNKNAWPTCMARDGTLISWRNICRRGLTVSIKNKVNFGWPDGKRWLVEEYFASWSFLAPTFFGWALVCPC